MFAIDIIWQLFILSVSTIKYYNQLPTFLVGHGVTFLAWLHFPNCQHAELQTSDSKACSLLPFVTVVFIDLYLQNIWTKCYMVIIIQLLTIEAMM